MTLKNREQDIVMKSEQLASRCPNSIPHDETAVGGKVQLDLSLGAAQQRAAWEAFEAWLKRLSGAFVGEDIDVPLTLLAEWYGKGEPIGTTINRCLDHRIANL